MVWFRYLVVHPMVHFQTPWNWRNETISGREHWQRLLKAVEDGPTESLQKMNRGPLGTETRHRSLICLFFECICVHMQIQSVLVLLRLHQNNPLFPPPFSSGKSACMSRGIGTLP